MSTGASTEATGRAAALAARYRAVRAATVALQTPLAVEDQVVQSMTDTSPTRWHLAHTTWFFETFVLADRLPGYASPDPAYAVLFNSYYEGVGERFPRPQRGLLTRPTVAEVLAYREHVDRAMETLLAGPTDALSDPCLDALELGLQHEQQHQELVVTDLKHLLSLNPLAPAYRTPPPTAATAPAEPLAWIAYPAGVQRVGYDGAGFCFDNERPRHRVFLEPYALGDRLVTNAEYQTFVEDGGYARAELWLSEGWDLVQRDGWQAPLYWREADGGWAQFTLAGLQPLDPAEPVSHLSQFEADAYARWAGARLPTEAEWERAAADVAIEGIFAEAERLAPAAPPARSDAHPRQLFGDLWEWTSSAYAPYPGYAPLAGALGEYNGKFMVNQYVLRGGSYATPGDHIRATYRNFFPSHARWQCAGVRLARTLPSS